MLRPLRVKGEDDDRYVARVCWLWVACEGDERMLADATDVNALITVDVLKAAIERGEPHMCCKDNFILDKPRHAIGIHKSS